MRHVFTLSGLHVAPIYAGLRRGGDPRSSTPATSRPRPTPPTPTPASPAGVGVAVVTAGPGVTDALTGVANANAASSPLILLGGAAPMFNQSRGSLQEMEQVDLFHRISKWSDRVPSPELVPLYLAKAFRVALSGRPGPVFLELAWDVLCNGGGRARRCRCRGCTAPAPGWRPDPRAVEEALALLAAAERPAMIAGSSVFWDDAWDALRAFVERAQIPTYLNGAGRGCLPPDHPLFFQHTRKEALSGADLVFVVGHAVRLPAQLRHRAHLQRRLEDRPGRRRSHRGGAEPSGGGRHRRRQPLGARRRSPRGDRPARRGALPGQELRAAEARKLEALAEWTRSDAVPIHHYRLATRDVRAWPTPAAGTRSSSPTAGTGWRWRPRC